MFAQFIMHTMEIYMNDMITKNEISYDHVKHPGLTFNILGFMVSHKGIESNPKKNKELL